MVATAFVAVLAAVAAPLAARTLGSAEATTVPAAGSGTSVQAGPAAVLPSDVYTTAVTSGDSALGLYSFLAARPNRLVHLDFVVSKALAATLSTSASSVTVASGCTDTSTTASCVNNLNPAGLTVTMTGSGVSVAKVSLGYAVTGDVRVGLATRDSKGFYIVPVRGQVVAVGTGEDRD